MTDDRRRGSGPKTLRATWRQVLGPVLDAVDSLRTGSRQVTARAAHVRDGISVRRIFVVYLVALAPLVLFGLYNCGLQIHLAVADGLAPLEDWRTGLMRAAGLGAFDPGSIVANFVHGALYMGPLLAAVYILWMYQRTMTGPVRARSPAGSRSKSAIRAW